MSSHAGRKPDGWRYLISLQRSEEPALKIRALDKNCVLYSADILKSDLERQRQGLGMMNWEAYFTFLKGVLCDGKGSIEIDQVECASRNNIKLRHYIWFYLRSTHYGKTAGRRQCAS